MQKIQNLSEYMSEFYTEVWITGSILHLTDNEYFMFMVYFNESESITKIVCADIQLTQLKRLEIPTYEEEVGKRLERLEEFKDKLKIYLLNIQSSLESNEMLTDYAQQSILDMLEITQTQGD